VQLIVEISDSFIYCFVPKCCEIQVLENVTGLSGTYVRFQAANSDIGQERFYKPGFQEKSKSAATRFSRLLAPQSTTQVSRPRTPGGNKEMSILADK
jgi:hypothetical protein